MEQAQAKKDCKLAPGHYFKIPKKDIVNNKLMMPSDIYTTKKHKVSTLKKMTMVDEIQKIEGKKQLGPGTYPVKNLIKASEMTTRDMTEQYKNGLCKSNSE